MRRNGYTREELQRLAQDRGDLRVLIGGLYPRRGYRLLSKSLTAYFLLIIIDIIIMI